jgi:hypothetical protein
MLYKYVHYVYTTDNDSVDPANLVAAPWILHWSWYSKTSVVRQAECAEATNGQFIFTGLPAGNYVALVNVRVTVTTSSVAIDEQLGMTPSGEVAPVYTDRVIHGAGFADGWIVLGGGFKIPSDGLVHVAQDSSWYTAAHLSGGNRIDPHMKIQK